MNPKLKRQEVTSGRLAGTLKVNRQTPAGPPDAAFSLYSTDSEEQVSTLHRGLDRCAVLLDHILQADAAGISSPQRTPSEAVQPGGELLLGRRSFLENRVRVLEEPHGPSTTPDLVLTQ
ncbi:hypothetical protein FQA47_003754 [Oryzias melastigma]|uniref:Uncharacterized protein n=1 Tax=Oryzias melastigma TaxID=30732 RepID=A0A834CAS3_ORYME|nr:hypothetical protein FQA47_003754 [Oryzias melastigma]